MGEVGSEADGGDPNRPAAARRRRRGWLVAGGVAVLAVVVGVGAYLRGADDDAFCEALDRPVGDVGRFDELVVFLDPLASDRQIGEVEDVLVDDLGWTDIDWVDRQEAYDEFVVLFGDDPEMMRNVTPDVLPESFRVVPPADLDEPPASLEDAPGVFRIVMPVIAGDATALDVIEWTFASRPGEVPGAFERRMWEVGGQGELFAAIELDAAIGGADGQLATDLRIVDDAMDAIVDGRQPDSAVASATDRVIAAYDEQCPVG